MRRVVSALWSGFWLLVLLAAAPAGLVYLTLRTLRTLPDHWPTAQEWTASGQRPHWLPAMILVGLGWMLWALIAVIVVREAIRRIRRVVGWLRGKPLPPLPTRMQATASGMIGAAVFGMPANTSHNPPPAPTPTATAALDHINPSTADPAMDLAKDPAVTTPVNSPTPTVDPDPTGDRRGVNLPDRGWLDDHTARLVASAASMVWLQRRRHYIPRLLIAGPVRNDADLVPLPPTVAAVRAALQPTETDDASPGDTTTGTPAETPVGELPAVLTVALLPPGGVGLTGPGATDAARGLLVTTMLSTLTTHQPDAMRLVTTVEDISALLGPGAAAHLPISGLTVVGSLDDLISLLDQHTIQRACQRPTPAGDISPVGRGGAPSPVVVIASVSRDADIAASLAAVLSSGDRAIAAVLLGTWPHGPTWHVDANGHIRAGEQSSLIGRWCVLSPTAATDLLAVVWQAAPTTADPSSSPREADLAAPDPPPAPKIAAQPPTVVYGGVWHGPAEAGSTASLQLRLLGPPTLYRTDNPPTPVTIQRSAALQILVFLAVHPHGATSDQLIAALWPGPRPVHAGNRLYTPAAKLRATLRNAAGVEVLIRDSGRYRLNPASVDVDLWQLHTSIDKAATALNPPQRRIHLHAVISAYSGELAAGKDWPWLDVPREATRRHVIDAYLTLAEAEPRDASALLQAALRVDPGNTYLQQRVSRTPL